MWNSIGLSCGKYFIIPSPLNLWNGLFFVMARKDKRRYETALAFLVVSISSSPSPLNFWNGLFFVMARKDNRRCETTLAFLVISISSSPSPLNFWNGLFLLQICSEQLFKRGVSVKNKNWMANSVDPDEMAHYEPSHQDLHCLQKMGLQGWKD